MKTRGAFDWIRALVAGGVWLGVALGGAAQVVTNIVNDGTTDANLAKLCNVNGTGGAVVSLTVDSGLGVLVAEQSPDYTDIPLRACWYATNWTPAGGVYTVSASVKPAEAWPERQVGIMGWLNVQSAVGIAFQVRPGAVSGHLQVATINFNADQLADNETWTNLFNLDGTPATADSGSARSELGAYDPATYAILSLDFSAPTDADKAALSNVTARLTAKAFQPVDAPVQVGNTVELLTDLPLPPALAHQFGYFALWGSTIAPGGTIGSFDNLTVVGKKGSSMTPPTVQITTLTNGASFTAPADITLTAVASDPDGVVVKTELYSGGTALGAAATNKVSVTLRGLPPGTYSFVAKATDDSGNTSSTDPVIVEVKAFLLTDPTPLPDRRNFQQFQFKVRGMVGRYYCVYSTTNFVDWDFIESAYVTNDPAVLTYPVGAAKRARFFLIELNR